MKLSTLITTALFSGTVFGVISPIVQERNEQLANLPVDKQLNATLKGILCSILAYRDFGSKFVMFSTWTDSQDGLFIVPTLSEEDSDSAAMGLGYKLITDSNNAVGLSNTNDVLNVLEIKEENITAMGFSKLVNKDYDGGKSQEDYFPFGARKFMLIGANKSSIDSSDMTDNANASGLFNWWGEEKDDECDTNLFDTDHFLFVGVGSVKEDQLYTGEEDESMNIQNEVVYETEYITIHTTVTMTVTKTTHDDHMTTYPPPEVASTTTATSIEPSPTTIANGEFDFQLPGDDVKEVPMTTSGPTLIEKVHEPHHEEKEYTFISTTITTTHDGPTHVKTTDIPVKDPIPTQSWSIIEVESPEFSNIEITSSMWSSTPMEKTKTRVRQSMRSSSAIHFYSDYKSMTTKGVSMTRGFNSSHAELLNNGTIPNNGFGNFEIQTWNSFFGIVCLMATMAIFV